MNILQNHIQAINQICQDNNVRELNAFGSLVSGSMTEESDIDLVVDLYDQDPLIYSDHYFNLKFSLEDLFQRPVDLLEQKAIRNPVIRQEIEKTKVLIYAA